MNVVRFTFLTFGPTHEGAWECGGGYRGALDAAWVGAFYFGGGGATLRFTGGSVSPICIASCCYLHQSSNNFCHFWSLSISDWRCCTSSGIVCSLAQHSFKTSRKSTGTICTLAVETALDGALDVMWCDLWDVIYKNWIFVCSRFPVTKPNWPKFLF